MKNNQPTQPLSWRTTSSHSSSCEEKPAHTVLLVKNNQPTQPLVKRTTSPCSPSREEQQLIQLLSWRTTTQRSSFAKNNQPTQLHMWRTTSSHSPSREEQQLTQILSWSVTTSSHSSSHVEQPAHTAPHVKDNQSTQLLILLHICSLRSIRQSSFCDKISTGCTSYKILAWLLTIVVSQAMPATQYHPAVEWWNDALVNRHNLTSSTLQHSM